ncbi:MAG: hypothetical protein ACD_78C00385G0001 [uncultured bacterium (gcode 4)]|uniref:Uncharacterized protein n=1 Tax=uncultured bacterium (gcode 4) TaxID=1234023 RepID=K1XX17_9BACT|nr:MAG: hypothetical protein ACD_78C00385G0001 [uncultured bacterium (gcode 4)]
MYKNVDKGIYILFSRFDYFLHIDRSSKLERFQENEFHTCSHICKVGFLYLCDRILFHRFERLFGWDNLEFTDIGEIHIDREFRIVEINDDKNQE